LVHGFAAMTETQPFSPKPPADVALVVVEPSDTYTAVNDRVLAFFDAGASRVVAIVPSSRRALIYQTGCDDVIRGRRANIDTDLLSAELPVRLSDCFRQ
jgi:hypothetical protein